MKIFRILPAIVRVLMGLAFATFGLNGFFNFIPQPETPLPEGALAFAGALAATGYMLQLIAVTHLVSGLLLLVNRFVPLALVLLAPFLVNAAAFHIFLEPSGLPIVGIYIAMELYLAWVYRSAYRPLLTARSAAA